MIHEPPDEPRVEPRASPERLALRRPPFWSTGMVVMTTVLGVIAFTTLSGMVAALQAGEPGSTLLGPALFLVACLAGAGAFVGYRFWARRHPMPDVVFHPDAVELPASLEAVKSTRVPYSQIISVGVGGRPGTTTLLIETRRSVYLFPFDLFVDEEGPRALADELNRRVQALPEGPRLAEQARRRRELAERALGIRPIATQALLGILAVMFANQVLSGSLEDPFGLVRWGGNVAGLVADGQAFRLVTASFLHGHTPHFALNAVALYFVGRLVERVLGSVRFVTLYLLSGVAAMTASAYLTAGVISVGASGAILGLLGALAWINWRFRAELPLGLRQPSRVWLILLVVNSALVPIVMLLGLGRIDVIAHVAGFLVGAAVCAFMVRPGLAVGAAASPTAKATALALVLLHGVALTEGLLYAADFDEAEREVAVEAMLSAADDAMTLNNLAWLLVIDPGTSEVTLERARAAAERAVELEPGEGAFRDTLATAHYRLGAFDQAVDEERRAFALRSDPLMASQLARFLIARTERDGPVLLGGAVASALTLELIDRDQAGEPAAMRLRLERPFPEGLTAFATLRRGDQQLGLLHVVLGAGPASEHRFELGDIIGESLAGDRVRLELALIDASGAGKVDAGEVRWKLWEHDPEVDEYP